MSISGTGSTNSFSNIAVSGQSSLVADSPTSTLNVVAGSNISITTNAGTDSLTINASGSLSSTLNSGNIYIGDSSNVATAVVPSGDVTMSNTGVNTIKSSVNLASNPTTTTQSPSDNSTKIATTAYVTTAVANLQAALDPAIAVQAATTQASDTSGFIYNNGSSGVGATLTGPINTVIVIDGVTFNAINQRLLVKNDTQSPSGAFNGIYFLSALQTIGTGAIFTRALDYNSPSNINNTGAIPVVNGTANSLTSWLLTSSITTVGTDSLTYSKFTNSPISIISPSLGGTGSNLSATGGTSQVLKQISSGANITVGQLAASDLSNGTTGSGSAVLATSPTLITPVLGTPSSGTLTNATGLPEGGLSLTDITTNNVSTTKHGFAPKSPNDATKYLDGTGAYSVPPIGSAAAGSLTGTTLASNVVNSSLTTVGTIQTGTWQGTKIGTSYGGTNVTSVTTSPTATAFAGWDSNSNLSANNFINGYTTTATAAATTTLTVSSTGIQYFTGTTTQTVTLPVTSTLVTGQSFEINNLSTGVVTAQSSGNNTLQAMAANTKLIATCISTSGTGISSWNWNYLPIQQGITGTGNLVSATSPTLVTPVLGTPTSGTLTNCTGLPVAGGGTGLSSVTAYAPLCGGTTSTGAFQSIASVGTSGQVLTSNGASALPTMQTPEFSYLGRLTASSSTSLSQSLGSGLIYKFKLVSLVPSVSGTMLTAQLSANGGSTIINSSYLQANTWATTSDAPAGTTNKTTGLSLTGSDANAQTCAGSTANKGGINGFFYIFNPSASINQQANWETFYSTDTNNYQARTYGSGRYTGATAAVNYIQFLFKTANSDTTNGNIASGYIDVWVEN